MSVCVYVCVGVESKTMIDLFKGTKVPESES